MNKANIIVFVGLFLIWMVGISVNNALFRHAPEKDKLEIWNTIMKHDTAINALKNSSLSVADKSDLFNLYLEDLKDGHSVDTALEKLHSSMEEG